MHLAAQTHIVLTAQQIDAATRGERRERAVGRTESRGDNAQREGNNHPRAERSATHQLRKQGVGLFGQRDALRRTKGVEQNTQSEQQRVDGQKGQAVETHVFLRIAECAAGEIFLHHVLIQSGHDNDDENAREKLSPKGLRTRHIPLQHTTHGAFAHGRPHALHVESHPCGDCPQRSAECQEQHQTLKGVGIEESRLSATMRVEPNEQQGDGGGQGEGDAERCRHEGVQHQSGHIQAGGGTG